MNNEMNYNKIYVFTDIDLDGATSLLTLHWALGAKPEEISFETSTTSNLRANLLKWLDKHKVTDYDWIIFLDLDVSSCADLIDQQNVIIIDHHKSHVENKAVYKQAATYLEETTSCAKLLYRLYFTGEKPLTDKSVSDTQKYLIALADDYDCYKFRLTQSYDLNCLFTNTQRNFDRTRTHIFVSRWYNGFDNFNQNEKNIISHYQKERDKAISELKIYTGDINIQEKQVKVMGTFGTKYVNDICDHLINNLGAQVVFYVNTNSEHVSLRRDKQCGVDVAKLSTELCNGGGHEYAAGGKPTEKFMEFVKQLTPLNS